MFRMVSLRNQGVYLAAFAVLFVLIESYYLVTKVRKPTLEDVKGLFDGGPEELPSHPLYKPDSAFTLKSLPIVDNFPLADKAQSQADFPPIPHWNQPPVPHIAEPTPLYIGFTRNWRLLQQAVVSYIAAGWPPEDIYVVENTGVMRSNSDGRLSLQNPFFLNHTRLHLLGVNVMITPTLLTFAQLQNFYIWSTIEKGYDYYFWSHMDVVAVPFEGNWAGEHPDVDMGVEKEYAHFLSIYDYCVRALREAITPDPITNKVVPWAIRFFSYDRLALVNVEAFLSVGAWDTQIPYYMTDCDMHERIKMAGFTMDDKPAGFVFDVGTSLNNIETLYRKEGGPEASFFDPDQAFEPDPEQLESESGRPARFKYPVRSENVTSEETIPELEHAPSFLPGYVDDRLDSEAFHHILDTLDHMQNLKNGGDNRLGWQVRQSGGQGEPFYRDAEGFDAAITMTIEHGRRIFREKWGHRDCNLIDVGLGPNDGWRVEHDWVDE